MISIEPRNCSTGDCRELEERLKTEEEMLASKQGDRQAAARRGHR